jgi:O-acetyl-ADP-ribose deacetylase (regulator of RNase III)
VSELQLILVDPKPALCACCERSFVGLRNVTVVNGYFEKLPEFDCMVSAANSFGIMDGGVDAAIIAFFGRSLMQRVQQRILEEYLGEQPVGTSMIVETGDPQHPFVAHTPTMRTPMPIARTDHVYLAMWAMLLAVRSHNQTADQPIRTIACPGLGTTTGRVPFEEAARQMALAYRNFVEPPEQIDWQFAQRRQKEVRLGGDMGLISPREHLDSLKKTQP